MGDLIPDIAAALMPYIEPDSALARATEIAAAVELRENGSSMRATIWQILGRLDEYETVAPQIRGAAVEAIVKVILKKNPSLGSFIDG